MGSEINPTVATRGRIPIQNEVTQCRRSRGVADRAVAVPRIAKATDAEDFRVIHTIDVEVKPTQIHRTARNHNGFISRTHRTNGLYRRLKSQRSAVHQNLSIKGVGTTKDNPVHPSRRGIIDGHGGISRASTPRNDAGLQDKTLIVGDVRNGDIKRIVQNEVGVDGAVSTAVRHVQGRRSGTRVKRDRPPTDGERRTACRIANVQGAESDVRSRNARIDRDGAGRADVELNIRHIVHTRRRIRAQPRNRPAVP